jgi:hypothetical protein
MVAKFPRLSLSFPNVDRCRKFDICRGSALSFARSESYRRSNFSLPDISRRIPGGKPFHCWALEVICIAPSIEQRKNPQLGPPTSDWHVAESL